MQADALSDGYGQLLWTPSAERVAGSRLADYQAWLSRHQGIHTRDYHELWRWSIEDIDGFWRSIWTYFDVVGDGPLTPVLGERRMPGARWFPNARLNYAENIFRQASAERPALIARSEDAPLR
jgi:acetoacetyl-CoA synthetase